MSADMIGEDAAVVIEAVETHTRTGFIDVQVPADAAVCRPESRRQPRERPDRRRRRPPNMRIPVTHVKVFGWYDNEMGSYTGRLGELTAQIARSL